MSATKYQEGCAIDHTPSAAVTGGDVVRSGDQIGVANADIAASAQGAVDVGQVYTLTKSGSTGPVFAVGDPVYYDLTNSLAVKGMAAARDAEVIYFGRCIAAAATGDTSVKARLEAELPPCMRDKVWENATIDDSSKTLDVEDVGKVLNITGDDTNVVTLPATAAGMEFVIRAAGDGVRIAVSPNANDKILGADLSGTDNKDIILTAATAKEGDFIYLAGGHADGYIIRACRGIWAEEA
jgi:predicted RecA/RadA family phage recombinase